VVDLERDQPTLGFFETLESGHNVGLVQRCEKAQERRLYSDVKPRLEGRYPWRGSKAERGSAGGFG
jgi:hypothetical protein